MGESAPTVARPRAREWSCPMGTQTIATAYTNATALAAAIDLAVAAEMPDLATKLGRMLEVTTKPKSKTNGTTKAQLQNISLARRVAAFVWDFVAEGDDDAAVTSMLVVSSAGIPEVTTTQKAVHLLKVAAGAGWVERREIKSRVYWFAGDIDPRA